MSDARVVWRQQPAALKLTSSSRPQSGRSISGVGVYLDADDANKRFTFYLRFSNEVVTLIGKHMPYGIGPETPAYFFVEKSGSKYYIGCKYIQSDAYRLLWVQEDKPKWVRGLRRTPDENNT